MKGIKMEHREFAEIYDVFMKNVDYDSWYKFLRRFIKKKGTVLDLGCGTGELMYKFLKDGYIVTGIDISNKMLEIAQRKMVNRNCVNTHYNFIKASITDYIHFEKVDYIMCNFDTLNYLRNEKEFIKFLEKTKKNLKKEGILIFDVVTEEIFDEIFENDIFLDEEREYTSIWRHEKLGNKKHLVEIDLFIKEEENDNLYRKYNEKQYKYIYDLEWIVNIMEENGFEVFDTASNPVFGEGRIFFIFTFNKN